MQLQAFNILVEVEKNVTQEYAFDVDLSARNHTLLADNPPDD